MYKVRGKEFKFHTDASKYAESASRIFPAHLRASTGGGSWYWRGRYCGRNFIDIFFRG